MWLSLISFFPFPMGVSIHGVSLGSVVTEERTYMNSVKDVVYMKKVREKGKYTLGMPGGYHERPSCHISSTMASIPPHIRNLAGRETPSFCHTRVIRQSDVREAGVIGTSSALGIPCHRIQSLVVGNRYACVRCSRSCCLIGGGCRRWHLMRAMSCGCFDHCHVDGSWGNSCPWNPWAMAHMWNASHWSWTRKKSSCPCHGL